MQHRYAKRSSTPLCASVLAFALAFASQPALAEFKQQGAKLVATDAVGAAGQGTAVAVAADDATALVGGYGDGGGIGAAWVFIRSGGVWTQQGPKLVGTGSTGAPAQGWSVALSSEGNTAIVGAPFDNGNIGAAWVFTRSGGVWTQQTKLTGSDATAGAQQGFSVALSSLGDTAIVGGPSDNQGVGAAWVFTRSGGVWTQQGAKLVGSGSGGKAGQGNAVSLSSDGDNALVGGDFDNNNTGAAWVFTRSGGVWTQQGPKLVGSTSATTSGVATSVALAGEGDIAMLGGPGDDLSKGAVWVFTRSGSVWSQQGSKLVATGSSGVQVQGQAVALPFAGKSAVVGAPLDSSSTGAAWIFTQSGGVWSQQGTKLVGIGATGHAQQGGAVALSSDGRIVLAGGAADNTNAGAVWVFVNFSAAASHDFYGDGRSDILWRDTAGNVAMWQMSSGQVVSSTLVSNVPVTWSIAGQRDFDGDTDADILWRDTSGNVAIWLMHGGTVASSTLVSKVPTTWSIAGTGDFDGDGKADILWRDNTGNVAIWLMNGAQVTSSILVANVPTGWSIVGASGNSILWRDNTGNTAIWLMNGGTVASNVFLGNVPTTWSIAGTGDFNGDGNLDILWRDSSGNVAIWLLDVAGHVTSSLFVANVPTTWTIAETGDFNGDGKSDILWHDSSGNTAIWLMVGGTVSSNLFVSNVPASWAIQGAGAD